MAAYANSEAKNINRDIGRERMFKKYREIKERKEEKSDDEIYTSKKGELFHIQYKYPAPQKNRFSEPEKFISEKFKLIENTKRNYVFDEPEPDNVSVEIN